MPSWVYREGLQQDIAMRQDTPNAFEDIDLGCAPFRRGCPCTPARPLNVKKPYAETIIPSAEPSDTSASVRTPAECDGDERSRRSRSAPISAPNTSATKSRSATDANGKANMAH